MLEIEQYFNGSATSDSAAGDANIFLQNVLVEVIAENYKQMLYEWIFLEHHKNGRLLDPPIRANERVMSGLFGNAISAIAERSRPEVRIDKFDLQTQDIQDQEAESNNLAQSKVGRIDYLAWYSSRTFGIELKMVGMNCESCEVSQRVENKWKTVVTQAKDAQNWLRERQRDDKIRYPNPISIGLMVVVGRRAINSQTDQLDKKKNEKRQEFLDSLKTLRPRPQFIASYNFPEEFSKPARIVHGAPGSNEIFIPFIAFIARSVVNSKN